MSSSRAVRCLRQAIRTTATRPAAPRCILRQPRSTAISQHAVRYISNSSRNYKGLIPDTDEPAPKESEPIHYVSEPTPIEAEEFHERAEQYLEEIVNSVEVLAETKSDVEVDYSAGVLNIVFPPVGTYVLNKQPPNKQIWLSSPVSGPKRFDWVVMGESMNQKEGSGVGDWIYLRDNTSLTALLRKELGITVGESGQP